jgi:hypothetical protein
MSEAIPADAGRSAALAALGLLAAVCVGLIAYEALRFGEACRRLQAAHDA